jgi:hypothetical protein
MRDLTINETMFVTGADGSAGGYVISAAAGATTARTVLQIYATAAEISIAFGPMAWVMLGGAAVGVGLYWYFSQC